MSVALSCLLVLVLGAFPHLCSSSLMGVDLGLGYIKVAVARPGKGLELVTNEQAKRKTPAAVGFTEDGERLFGDAAVAYAAKAPSRVILDGRSLIGRCATAATSGDDVNDKNDDGVFCARYRLDVDDAGQFTGEDVVAMLLAMARRQASAFLGGMTVKDVAVTVPAWFDERQRLAIFDAARVIGLNCLGVVNANTAAAIKYALDGKAKPTAQHIEAEKAKDKKKRAPKSVSQRVLFFDVGAGSASASVVEITSDVKTGIASGVRVLSHASEQGVGGRLLDTVIVDRLADAFDQQRGGPKASPKARELPRVMTRLRKEAQRAREVLSANTETMVSIASLYDDMDLRTQLSRADFEADAASMLRLVVAPANAALASAGVDAKELDAVVPFGGASRTPRIQDEVRSALGVAALNKSINTDEAAVMGSVFFAASQSSTFRVRKMEVDDVYLRGVSVEIEREASGGLFSGSGKKKAPQTVEVFPDTGSKMPAKKTVSLNRNADFSMRIFLELDKTGTARFPQRTLYAKVDVKGVANVLEKMQDKKKAKSTTPRVAISFHLDRSGLVRIGTAESSADETIVVEREVEVKEEKKKDKKKSGDKKVEGDENNTASSDDGSTTGDGDASDGNKKAQSEDSTSSDSNSDEDNSAADADKDAKKKGKKKTRTEKSTQTVVHRHTLTVEYVAGEGVLGMQMSGKELEDAQAVLRNLEVADKERVERADAFNSLEGFILEIRSKVRGLDEDDDLFRVTTEEERESLVAAFDDAEDWMYTPDAKQIANLRKKHHEMRGLFTPMETRAHELARRPKMVEKLRSALTDSLQRAVQLRDSHEKANSTHVKEFETFPAFCEDIGKWLDDAEQRQDDAPLTQDPVVSLKDIAEKSKALGTELARLAKLDIPVAPKVVQAEADKDTDGVNGKGNITDAEAGTEDEQQDKDAEDNDLPPEPDAESAQADSGTTSGSKDEL